MITKEAVLTFQKNWGESIINIGKIYQNNGDFRSAAINFIADTYAYDSEQVLFKPTLASEYPFRLTSISALSYFIGGDPNFSEDQGFAIKGWTNIRWENSGISIIDRMAICMGNYYFTNIDGELKGKTPIEIEVIKSGIKILN